jgi:hypothetical protein
MPSWLVYTGLRLAIFGGTFALLYLLGIEWWIAAVAAAIIGLCVSYLALGGLRARVAESLAAARAKPRSSPDDDAEDAADDATASERDRRGQS